MQYLKADTATTIRIGPFVDSTDGVTAETALAIAQADVRLSKNGAAAAQKADVTSATHDENGYYRVPLAASDVDTEGTLDVCVSVSGALPVVVRYMTVPAQVYDSIVTGADKLQVDANEVSGTVAASVATAVWDKDVSLYATAGEAGTVLKTAEANTSDLKDTSIVKANIVQISGDTVAADNLESYCDGTTPIPANITQVNGSAASVSTAVDANVTQVAGASVTGVNDFKADVSGVPTAGAVADAVWDEALSGHTSAGSAGKALADAEADADAILTDTGTTLPTQIGALNDPSAAQVASAVRSELTAELGRIDAAITSREASGAAAAAAAGLNDPTAAAVATAVRSELGTELGRIDAAVSSRAAAGDAMALTAGERTSVATALLDLANGVESGITTRQALRAMLAVLAGKVSGMDANDPVFRSADDTANRVSATTDSSGNRSAVTLNLS